MTAYNLPSITDSFDVSTNSPLPEFVNFDQKLKCSSCKGILLSPMQLPCGHRICSKCYSNLTSSSDPLLNCPSQDEYCEKFSRDQIHPDYSATREIKQLAVFCFYKKYGCKDTMPWQKLKSHIENCKFRKKICTYCNEEMPVEEFQKHIDNECELVPCSCPYNCGDVGDLKRIQLENHKKNCRLKPRECKFKSVGCKFQGNKEMMTKHEANAELHVNMMIEHTLGLNQEIDNLKSSLHKADNNIESLQEVVTKLEIENTQLSEKLSNLEKDSHHSMAQHSEVLANQTTRICAIDKKVEKFAHDLQAVKTKQNQQDSKIGELESAERSPRSGLSLPEDIRQQFITHDRTIAVHDMRVAELDLRLQCLQTANYEGVLIWKIADFHKRKQEANDGNIVSLYSQPFYTSRYGYKMCGRVYLNGDGIGKGTHMSLFFVVMQGDYDDILTWPFKQKVTLTLIDQKNNRRHLSDSFRPDPASSSFQKPRNPMNVASGCPLFVKQSVLEDRDELYLRNNTIYIKITIDTSDLLNP